MIANFRQKIRKNDRIYKCLLTLGSIFDPTDYSKTELFCLFIGYPRSGHTLLGALLDAHPNIVLSIEADVIGLMERGYNKKQIFQYILRRCNYFSKKLDCTWTNYSYKVPGSFQGNFTSIKILGDKKGSKTTQRLRHDISLLCRFGSTINLPVKLIHVVRNPFDNITTIYKRTCESSIKTDPLLLEQSIDFYFSNAETNHKILLLYPDSVLTIYHEDLIAEPKNELQKVFGYLEAPAQTKIIEQCAAIVYEEAHKSRNNIQWPQYLIEKTEERIRQFPFLDRYSWNE